MNCYGLRRDRVFVGWEKSSVFLYDRVGAMLRGRLMRTRRVRTLEPTNKIETTQEI